jgi:hypothetical protein
VGLLMTLGIREEYFTVNPMFESVKQRHKKVLIIGGGESLIGFNFEQTKGFDGAIITVNRIIEHIPRADYWISGDLSKPQKPLENMKEDCYYYAGYPTIITEYNIVEGVHYLDKVVSEDYQLQGEKNKVTGGVDSIYCALNLAYHFEAEKIVLLGVDCYGYGHWYDKKDPYNGYGLKDFKEKFTDRLPEKYSQSLVQLKNTVVINGSEKSRIECFRRMKPQEAYNMIK